MVVVADAGMLSASNLNAIEDAGFSFIVGSRITKAPYDLAAHFTRHGDYFADGQILESSRVMGSGKHERRRRVVYQWSFKRSQRDNKTINAQIVRAEKATAGKAPVTRTRFLKVTGATRELNQKTIDRARQLAGLKGYVTNLDPAVMDGAAAIAAYHELWQVEASFRMTKSEPTRPTGLPPRTRSDRSPSDRRLRRPRRQPLSPEPVRRQHQEARPDPARRTFSDHRHQRPAPHPRPRTHTRRPSTTAEASRGSLRAVARVRSDVAIASVRAVLRTSPPWCANHQKACRASPCCAAWPPSTSL
jgi:hypothetical protein